MRPIRDFEKERNFIKRSIKKYGHCSEHNYYHYKYCEGDGEKNYFFKLKGTRSILCSYNKKEDIWSLFPSAILAPKEERLDLFLELLDYVFIKRKISKVCVEVDQNLRKNIMKKLKDHPKFRASKSYDILYWPIYHMPNFDPKLKGKKWKKLRNIRNRFKKKHRVRIVDSRKVPKEQLIRILNSWLKRRRGHDYVDKYYYENLIKNNFRGLSSVRTLIVDGIPRTITGGWNIPNSKGYYSNLGIFDYSFPGLGEVANIEDLKLQKRMRYKFVDFGGSDKTLLYFKKKFKPDSIYKTYLFSIFKRGR